MRTRVVLAVIVLVGSIAAVGGLAAVQVTVSPASTGGYVVSAWGEPVGTFQVTNAADSQSLLSNSQKVVLGALAVLGGVLLFITAFAVVTVRAVKRWQGNAAWTSSEPALYVLFSSVGLFTVGGVVLTGSIGVLALSIAAVTLCCLGLTYSVKGVLDLL